MISQLINFLITSPTPATAPLYTAVNSTAVINQLGNTVPNPVAVTLMDTRDAEGNPPYVRLYDTGEVNLLQDLIGGQYRAYIEQLFMGVEVAAYGPSASSAGARADYLRLAAEASIQKQIAGFTTAQLPGYTDLAGSGASDSIFYMRVVGGRSNSSPRGPGNNQSGLGGEQWTVSKHFRVEVQVRRTRIKY